METIAKKQSFINRWMEKNDSRIKEWRHSVRLFFKSPLAVIGLIIVIGFILVAIFAPMLAPYPLNWRDFALQNAAPSDAHLLGNEIYGGDIFSMIIWGSRTSLLIGFFVVFVCVTLGTLVGVIAAYYGGWVDEALMRVTDIFLAFPYLVLCMVIVAALGSGLMNVMIAMAIVSWPSYARLIRGQVLSIKERNYIEAARSVGASDWRIMTRHILPNSFSPIIVQSTMDLGSIMITAAALSFIGMGAGPGEAEWGRMITDGQSQLLNAPWISTFPGLAILIVCLGFNLFGDGLRDILDPKMRR
ncbi:MAG: D-ala-D-ala transporter subunit [Methanocella sp. PtaU1.Bin125]|nr:MAG: D-ala-D-ala transporter subunit [Methanocella sp. PtaU1.Bin125]